MALDSIAKLAVIITGDESPLAASTRRAEGIVSGSADRMGRSSLQLGTIMSASRGNVAALFKVAGGSALAMAAIVKVTYELASAGDRLDQALGAEKLNTWSGQWDRLKTAMDTTAGIAGGSLSLAFRQASSDLATLVDWFNAWVAPEKMEKLNRLTQAHAEIVRKAVRAGVIADPTESEDDRLMRLTNDANNARRGKIAKELNDEAKRNAEEIARIHERERDAQSDFQKKLFDRAAAIRDMVRTPTEEFRKSVSEFRDLFISGVIDQETMDRAIEAANKRFNDAENARARQKSKEGGQSSFGAVDRFTMGGYSAMVQAGLATQNANQQAKAEVETARNTKKIATEQERFHAELLQFVKSLPGVGITDLN